MRFAVRSSPSRTCWLAIFAALRVTDAVTNGLPSRSPPTHEPTRTKGLTIGAREPAAGPCRASSTRRYTCGTAVKRVSSKTSMIDAHLVGGRGLLRAQRRGAPQRVDLLDHAALGPSLVGAVAQHDVVLVEQLGQAADAARDRAAARLGGVRGEHGVEPQRLQACERGVVADLGGQMHERGGDRVGGILPIGAPVALPEDPHPLVLLDEVHEVEVHGERPGDLVGALDAERVGDHRGALERLRRLVGVRLDRRGAQALHVVEQTGGAALAEHTTEQRAQHPHIRAHPLGDLLACFITSDQVDRFGLGELTHASTLSPALFRSKSQRQRRPLAWGGRRCCETAAFCPIPRAAAAAGSGRGTHRGQFPGGPRRPRVLPPSPGDPRYRDRPLALALGLGRAAGVLLLRGVGGAAVRAHPRRAAQRAPGAAAGDRRGRRRDRAGADLPRVHRGHRLRARLADPDGDRHRVRPRGARGLRARPAARDPGVPPRPRDPRRHRRHRADRRALRDRPQLPRARARVPLRHRLRDAEPDAAHARRRQWSSSP